jgi:hypothetical protein
MKYFQFQLADKDIRCSQKIDFQTSVPDLIGKTYSKKRTFFTFAIFTALAFFSYLQDFPYTKGGKQIKLKGNTS